MDTMSTSELEAFDAAGFEAEALTATNASPRKRTRETDSAPSTAKRARGSAPNPSLVRRSPEQYEMLKKIARENGCNPAVPLDILGGACSYKFEGGCLKLVDTTTKKPMQTVTPVVHMTGFINDDGTITFRITEPRGTGQETPWTKAFAHALGVGLVDAMCTGKTLGQMVDGPKIKSLRIFDKKTGEINPKVKQALLADLKSGAGERPAYMSVLAKEGFGQTDDDDKEEGDPIHVINACKTRLGRRRTDGSSRPGDTPEGVPAEIAEAFLPGDLVYDYFLNNKDVDPNPFAVSAADGSTITCWKLIAAAALPTRSGGQWMPLLGQLRLGGINCKFLKEYNLLKVSTWNNGLTVFGLPNYGEAKQEPVKQANLDMYAAIAASGM